MDICFSTVESVSPILNDLQEEYADWRSQKSPEYSTSAGLNKYNDRLETFAYSGFEKEYVCNIIYFKRYLKKKNTLY
jgi:hypothetical protein